MRSDRERRRVRCLLGLLLLAVGLVPGLPAQDKPAKAPPPETVTSESSSAKSPAPETATAPTENGAAAPVANGDTGAMPGAEPISDEHARWLEEIDPLITRKERALFLSLAKPYQRDAFIQQFWRVRDPHPRTARNELKDRWPVRLAEAKNKYGSLTDDRARIYLTHGPANGGFQVLCSRTYSPAEVWIYSGGSEQVSFPFLLVFLVPRTGRGIGSEARVWRPGVASFALDDVIDIAQGCLHGGRLAQVVEVVNGDIGRYQQDLQRVLAKPRPSSEEWVDTFAAFSTELPPDAQPITAQVALAFPGRHQNRTVVQGVVNVPASQAAVAEFAGYRSYDFQLTGEVLVDGSLFESFRYKFGFPAGDAPATIPLAFQRYLRPGDYRLILRLDDLNSKAAYRSEQEFVVPQAEGFVATPAFQDQVTAQLFAEATAAMAAGETGLRIIPPQGDLHTGLVRFDTLVSGDVIDKVRFFLDDKFVLTKNQPPFNVEIDLGTFPKLHTLRVEGLDAESTEVARDELLVNSGGYRFAIKLVEPRRGKSYDKSLQARAEVQVPEGRSLDRVELFLNETLVTTLYQEPYVHPIVLPPKQEVAYVRAVAYLPDGNFTEDLVFINAPEYLEELDIQFVELYTTALDGQGRPVEGLEKGDFKVLEDGTPQTIARFEKVENLPIHVGILIDNSASMHGTLGEVRKAALSFLQQAVTPKDRAAVITFNSFPHLAVELTNDTTALGGGFAGLTAEGQTALYDSVMFGLYYFTGVKGQRAILVLSDGKDESSHFGFDETLEYARRAGITIFAIGLRLDDGSARQKLVRLADETGGRSFFIRDITELEDVYSAIQREVRSQYLIAYQSTNTSQESVFRNVELKVDRPGVTVKTLSGYYP